MGAAISMGTPRTAPRLDIILGMPRHLLNEDRFVFPYACEGTLKNERLILRHSVRDMLRGMNVLPIKYFDAIQVGRPAMGYGMLHTV